MLAVLLALPTSASTTIVEAETTEYIEQVVTWKETFAELPADLQAVAVCESNLIPDAKNPYSSASGLFQFINGTYAWVWSEVYGTPVDYSKKNDPFIQIELATWLYENHGLSHWECHTLGLA